MLQPPDSEDIIMQGVIQGSPTLINQSELALEQRPPAATGNNPSHCTRPHVSTSSTSAPSITLKSLPLELQREIFSHLNEAASLCFGLTCRHFYEVHWQIWGPVPLGLLFEKGDILCENPMIPTCEDYARWLWCNEKFLLLELLDSFPGDQSLCTDCWKWRYTSKVGWKNFEVLMMFIPPGMWHESFFEACRTVWKTFNASKLCFDLVPVKKTEDFHNISRNKGMHYGECGYTHPDNFYLPEDKICSELYTTCIEVVGWTHIDKEPISYRDFYQVLTLIWESIEYGATQCLHCAAVQICFTFGHHFCHDTKNDEFNGHYVILKDRRDLGQEISGAWSKELGIVAQQYCKFGEYGKKSEESQDISRWEGGFQSQVNSDDIWEMMQDWGDVNL